MNLKDKAKTMNRKALSTIEYAMLIGFIAAALIAMQVYVKRAIQGNLRDKAQLLSEGSFYSPGATVGDTIINAQIQVDTQTTTVIPQDNTEPKIQRTTTNSFTEVDKSINEEILGFREEPRRW
jgi:Flp pilus assembly pilin Flp